jgi:BirA family transcriptional regulator, biotin operon repressor / biotin---[acetyl-CoA-carboxylase] ligase
VPPEKPLRPPLDRAVLRDASAGSPWRVEVLEESPSTNAHVAGLARAGERPGLVLVAEHQTAGRGRLDRAWSTPARAALTLSLLVAPDSAPVERWPWLPLLTGLAVVDAVRREAGLDASLKWPNDVLVDEHKVAGILVERVESPGGAMAVVGVGLNVSASRDELPVASATSLVLAGAGEVDRTALLLGLLDAFRRRYDDWCAASGHGPRTSYAAACSTVGRPVRVELPGGGSLSGTAVGVDGDGRLHVDDGRQVHVLGAGDVVHVRPAASGPLSSLG